MEGEEIVTLYSYRWEGQLAVVVAREGKRGGNDSSVYHMGSGEHVGIVVNKPIMDASPPKKGSLQIPIVCEVSDKTKTWAEVRRLEFSFREDYGEQACKTAALDFHHDLLHPDIFQRDYCGFIITMVKILQHRYPEIEQVCCSFQTLHDSVGAVLKHLQKCYPKKESVESIVGDVLVGREEVMGCLTYLVDHKLVECVGEEYVLRVDEQLATVLEMLEDIHPRGLSAGDIFDQLGMGEHVVKCGVGQGYILEKGGQYYIRRLEDHEIQLVFQAVQQAHPRGITPTQIMDYSHLPQIVVLSSLNLLEEKGDVVNSEDMYNLANSFTEEEYEVVRSHLLTSGTYYPETIATATNIPLTSVAAILSSMSMCGDILCSEGIYSRRAVSEWGRQTVLAALSSRSGVSLKELCLALGEGEFYTQLTVDSLVADNLACRRGTDYYSDSRCTDSDIATVLRALESVSPGGLSATQMDCGLGQVVVRKALAHLTARGFVKTCEDKYYSRNFEEDCEEIIRVLSTCGGATVSEIGEKVGIQSEVLVKDILRYLEGESVELVGKMYYYGGQDLKRVLCLLADCYPKGMSASELGVPLDTLGRLREQVYCEDDVYYYQPCLSTQDYEQVLRVLEAAYPNSATLLSVCTDTKLSEAHVLHILHTLIDRQQVAQVDTHVFRRASTIADKYVTKGDVQGDPTIAIFTADYVCKVAIDVMMTDISTYLKYKLGGESSVYTLGRIAHHRVVSTKFSHGYSQASAISIGNATTRLLGTFPHIQHVIILGLGGAVTTSHVRLGDVVVSHNTHDNSLYYMATNFATQHDHTVSYTVKRWASLNPTLHQLAATLHTPNVFPWEDYITHGQALLSDATSSHDFHRPPPITDPFYRRAHPLPNTLTARPRICLGTVGAGRYLHRDDHLKAQFVEKTGVIAFDDEYDQVTESIHGNCVDSFLFIRGISDYVDGTHNELWQPYAALAAAAVLRYILENL